MLNLLRKDATSAFMLYWEGSCRVPSGVSLNEDVLSSTQHGLVKNAKGKIIGTYQRLLDGEQIEGNNGPKKTNAMLVFI